ncbi:hypothetical protein R5R35_013541 [Gryllus longicercus]|uniref:Hemolymph juvenile hormone binding protein n=1 Tax=Gryllus longicercus TaxID=2509291 RepID=A0AAN9VFM8_9ORTH
MKWIACALAVLCVASLARRAAGEAAAAAAAAEAPGQDAPLGDKVRAVVRHFQQEDPVGMPVAPVPDPLDVPEMKHSFSVATMTFKNVKVHGQSKFRLQHVRSDLAAMQMSVGATISKLDILGRYTMAALWSRSQGNFSVLLTDVYVEGVARLEVQRSGRLQAQEINLDITFGDIAMNFENLGFMGSVFQGIINSVGTFLFDSIKPFILREINKNVRGEINREVEKYPKTFPNSISPLDKALADARDLIRERQLDPYYIPNYNYTAGLFNVYLTHVWLTGLATIYREGNVTVNVEQHVMYAAAHVATQRLMGKCHWEVSIAGLLSRAGTASFSVDYLHVMVNVSQPLDTRKTAKLEALDLKLGNIQARMEGAGTLDYVAEFVVNILPNVLRNQIVNALEEPLKRKIQEHLNKTDVSELIEKYIPQIEAQLATTKVVEE